MRTIFRKLVLCSFCTLPFALLGCSNLVSQGVNVDGVKMHQRGEYQSAANRFRQAIAEDPTSADGYYNLAATMHKVGQLYGQQNDLSQAENLYNQCLERDSNHEECYRGLAVLLTQTNRTDAAFRLLQGWKDLSPKNAGPRIELARLLQETGSAESAKGQLVEALAMDPRNSRALTALGQLRDKAGDYTQAIENYQRSLAMNTNQPAVRNRIAALQSVIGRASVLSPSTSETRIVRQPSTSVRY